MNRKRIIFHKPSEKIVTRYERITRCPMGKHRKMAPNDSLYNEVCDGCLNNVVGHFKSEEELIYCDYVKQPNKTAK